MKNNLSKKFIIPLAVTLTVLQSCGSDKPGNQNPNQVNNNPQTEKKDSIARQKEDSARIIHFQDKVLGLEVAKSLLPATRRDPEVHVGVYSFDKPATPQSYYHYQLGYDHPDHFETVFHILMNPKDSVFYLYDPISDDTTKLDKEGHLPYHQ